MTVKPCVDIGVWLGKRKYLLLRYGTVQQTQNTLYTSITNKHVPKTNAFKKC
jgi:hypothetical protein